MPRLATFSIEGIMTETSCFKGWGTLTEKGLANMKMASNFSLFLLTFNLSGCTLKRRKETKYV